MPTPQAENIPAIPETWPDTLLRTQAGFQVSAYKAGMMPKQ
jgi:hypothetical protein